MNASRPSMLKAAVIGGGAAGVVSAIPIVGALNCACCALVIGGGLLAAYLYSRSCAASGVEFGASQGALVGLSAAPFYALAVTLLGLVVRLVLPQPDASEILSRVENSGADIPPAFLEWLEWFLELMGSFLGVILYFVFSLLLGAIFSTVGGLIGGSAFKSEPRQQPPATVTG